jgi:hypothetical protein
VGKGSGSVNRLQDLMLRRLAELGSTESPMPLRRATERARGLVPYEIVRKIGQGDHSGRIEDSTAEGLPMALDVPGRRSIARPGCRVR